MTTYFNLINGNPIQPSQVSYRQITLNSSQTLNWTTSGLETANIVTLEIDLISNNSSYTLTFPPANQVSTGMSVLIYNKGSHNTSILNNVGTQIANAVAGTVIFLYITDNSTVAGTWNTFTFGTGTSSADASTLAGLGLKAIGSLLNTNISVNTLGAITSYDVLGSDLASLLVWTGGVGNIQLPDPGTIYPGFYVSVHNASTVGGQVTMLPAGGNFIDGAGFFELNPGQSSFFILSQDNTNWYSLGFGQETFFVVGDLVVDVTGQTTIVINDIQSQNLLQFYTGVLSNDVTILLPDVNGQYYVFNQTTGAFNLFVALAATPSTKISIAQGQSLIFASNGTTLYTIPSQPPTALFGNGTQASPSIAFVSEPDLGLYKVGTGIMGFAVGGLTTPIQFTLTGLKVIDGTISNPALSFISESNLGLYKVASNAMGVAVNGVLVTQFVQTGISILAGSAATPSISILGNTNTGIYSPSSNVLGFATNGILTATIGPSGLELLAHGGTATILSLQNPAGTHVTSFVSGAIAADTAYTFPTALPSSSGQILAATTAGIMSWITPGSTSISLPDGTAGAPSLFFTTHPTTGIYEPAADTIGFTTAGVERAAISSTGLTVISGQILATNGIATAPSLSFSSTPSAGFWTDGVRIIANVIGSTPSIAAFSTNGFNIYPNKQLYFRDATDSFNTVINGSLATANVGYILPPQSPTISGQPLVSTTTGIMSWASSNFTANGLTVPVGAVGTPSLTFTGDLTTGVYQGGAGVTSVASTGTQVAQFNSTGIDVLNGSAALPSYAFLGAGATTGMYLASANNIGLSTSGVQKASFNSTGIDVIAGTAAAPSFAFLTDGTTGAYLASAGVLGLAAGGVGLATISSTGLTLFNAGTPTSSFEWQAPAAPAANYTYIMPSSAPAVGKNLQVTNVAGTVITLDWV